MTTRAEEFVAVLKSEGDNMMSAFDEDAPNKSLKAVSRDLSSEQLKAVLGKIPYNEVLQIIADAIFDFMEAPNLIRRIRICVKMFVGIIRIVERSKA